MKKSLLFVLLAVCVVVSSGCIAVVGNQGGSDEDVDTKSGPSAVMADIDVVKNLSQAAKVDGYIAILERQRLTLTERAHFVEAVKNDSLTPEQKDKVLVFLLQVPPDVKKCDKK